jgi:DNA-binding winged helix-turn-helix (wHTH) protein/tetratricopeptide (TPR) repeat protein
MPLLFGDYELDPVSGELRRGGRPVALQAKLHAILLHLVQNRDRWVTKSQLLAHVWPGVAVSDATIGGTISDLRAALGDTGRRQQIIQTLRGRGYRFVAPVEETALTPAPSPAPAASFSFVGRDDVMADLEAALASALAGEGRMVLIAGEAGIGKTRTAREFVARARARGIPTYTGACSETGGAPAAWAWRQLLRGLVADREVETLRSELGARAARVAQIVPELRARLPRLPALPSRETPETARFELFDATVSFLRRVAEAKGLVLHLDDLHAGDEGTLGLLEFLANDSAGSRILAIAGHRDAEAECSHAFRLFLANTARLPAHSSIALPGLSADAARALVKHVLRAEPTASLVDAVMERTDGNPFLIRELVTYVARQPDGSLDGAAQGAVPDRIRETTRRRLASLASNTRSLVECAAVIGREFDLDLLARIAGQAGSGVRVAIEEAHQHELVIEPEEGRSRFVHVLLRDAVYRAQPAARRADTHRRIGEALESMRGADPDALVAELAHHFALAGDCNRKAIDYATRAGQRARDAFAYDDAASHFERALALLEHEPTATAIERCDLLLDLGRARMRESRRGEQRDAFRRAALLARSLGDAERLAEAARGFTYRTLIGIADLEGVDLVAEALAALPPADDRRRIHLLAFLAHLLQSVGRTERSDVCLAEASERAERLGDAGASADLARLAAHVEMARGSSPERILELARRAKRYAMLAADGTVPGHWVMTSALLQLGERAAADAEVAAAEAEARGDWFELFRVSQYRIMHRLAAGELAEAEAPIAACLDQERLRRGSSGCARER